MWHTGRFEIGIFGTPAQCNIIAKTVRKKEINEQTSRITKRFIPHERDGESRGSANTQAARKDRQTDRQTDQQTDKQTYRQINRQIHHQYTICTPHNTLVLWGVQIVYW